MSQPKQSPSSCHRVQSSIPGDFGWQRGTGASSCPSTLVFPSQYYFTITPCLRRPRPTHSCRADDDDDDYSMFTLIYLPLILYSPDPKSAALLYGGSNPCLQIFYGVIAFDH